MFEIHPGSTIAEKRTPRRLPPAKYQGVFRCQDVIPAEHTDMEKRTIDARKHTMSQQGTQAAVTSQDRPLVSEALGTH